MKGHDAGRVRLMPYCCYVTWAGRSMERCRDCNAILGDEERVCLHCGARVKESKHGGLEAVKVVMKAAGCASFALLIASPFVRPALNPVLWLLAATTFFLLSRNLDSLRRPLCIWCGQQLSWSRILSERDRRFCVESHRARFQRQALARTNGDAEQILTPE